jgi:hyperosmotically inducible protein
MKSTKPFLAALVGSTMLFALGCAGTKTQESTGEYLDDSTITTKVKTAIFNEPSLKVAQINVKTQKSVVQLSGFVDSSADRNKAGSVASAVKGVASVENDLKVK